MNFLFWKRKEVAPLRPQFDTFPWICWYIWKARNDKLFNGKDVSPLDTDVPQSTDHYMEPAQHGVQDVLNVSTEVHVFHRTRLNLDHARLDKDHTRLDMDHARLDLDHARLDLVHEISQNDRDFSLLARLAHTACTDDRADDLSTLFDPIMDFSFGNFSKARILTLSEDLGFVGMQLVRSERPAALADRPAYVLILTALDLAELVLSFLVSHIQVNTSSNRWTCESYQATTRDPSLGGLAKRCNEPFKSSQGEADPKRRFLQFDVQEFCDNFVEEVVKTLKDVNQTHKKSTSTRAPVAEPSLFISKKFKELTILQPENPSSLVFSPQVLEEEPLDLPHQGPCLDTRIRSRSYL
uniref:Uncharacterized protein n=1 Tax=Brassica oleracea var. oleracea TaxID=109376 RepID=A0A0D3BRW4_BRAOL